MSWSSCTCKPPSDLSKRTNEKNSSVEKNRSGDFDHEEDKATIKLAFESLQCSPEVPEVRSLKSNRWAPKGVGSNNWSAIWVTLPSKPKLLSDNPRLDGVIVLDDAQETELLTGLFFAVPFPPGFPPAVDFARGLPVGFLTTG